MNLQIGIFLCKVNKQLQTHIDPPGILNNLFDDNQDIILPLQHNLIFESSIIPTQPEASPVSEGGLHCDSDKNKPIKINYHKCPPLNFPIIYS